VRRVGGVEIHVGRKREAALRPRLADVEVARDDLRSRHDRPHRAVGDHRDPDRPGAVGPGPEGERVAGVRGGPEGVGERGVDHDASPLPRIGGPEDPQAGPAAVRIGLVAGDAGGDGSRVDAPRRPGAGLVNPPVTIAAIAAAAIAARRKAMRPAASDRTPGASIPEPLGVGIGGPGSRGTVSAGDEPRPSRRRPTYGVVRHEPVVPPAMALEDRSAGERERNGPSSSPRPSRAGGRGRSRGPRRRRGRWRGAW